MKFKANKHPANFTATRLKFLASQLFNGTANEGDRDEAAFNLAYMAELMTDGEL